MLIKTTIGNHMGDARTRRRDRKKVWIGWWSLFSGSSPSQLDALGLKYSFQLLLILPPLG